MKLQNIFKVGNKKLYVIFERRYGKLWADLVSSKQLSEVTKDFKSHNLLNQEIVDKWHEYLKNIGLKIVGEKPNGEYILDPSSKMGQSLQWPLYIEVPQDTALKILALGELP